MNKLQIFSNEDFGEVRTIEENGKVLFCGSDIAKALGYKLVDKAIRDHCKDPYRLKRTVGVETGIKRDGSPAIQYVKMNFIDEGNLYRLIINSKLPKAEKFERWVFDEVLPSIRKTGSYDSNINIQILQQMSDSIASIAEGFVQMSRCVSVINDNVMLMRKEMQNDQKVVNVNNYNASEISDFKPKHLSKIETFPQEIQDRVNKIISQMLEQDNVNYSYIARFCIENGYVVSNPAVKRYFDKMCQNKSCNLQGIY